MAEAASKTPWTAIINGASSVVNNLVNNIFNAKGKRKAEELKEAQQKYNQSLSTLSNQEKYVLDQKLNAAKTDTERMAIMANAIAEINKTAITNTGSNSTITAILVLISVIALLSAIFFIKKQQL